MSRVFLLTVSVSRFPLGGGGGSGSPPGGVLCPGVGGGTGSLGPGGSVALLSSVVYRLLRGLYHPVLGLALAQECCLVLGLAPPSAELHLGSPSAESRMAPPAREFGLDHPSVESCLAHPTRLPFCFSSPSWASLAWGLFWVLGSSPALPSWVSSQVAAPWIHLLPHQVRVLRASLIVPPCRQACPDPPPALKIHRGRLCVSGSPSFAPP